MKEGQGGSPKKKGKVEKGEEVEQKALGNGLGSFLRKKGGKA